MSKTRQRPDGSVTVRTYPVTFLHDVTEQRRDPAWHLLSFAIRGHLEVVTADARRLVPADRAVWIPAGVPTTSVMRAPVSVRSIFVATGSLHDATRLRTIAVTPLLREVILHVTRLGALDERIPAQARLAGVLFDLLAGAEDVPLELPLPRDPRARRFADLVTAQLHRGLERDGDSASLATLARRSGASLRTLERCFLAETGIPLGVWRRRVRLFRALHLLQGGASVTETSLDVGYANTSAFCQAYRRQFGSSPSGRTRARR
jgi:AraC-like DNA-binding protein